MLSKRSNTNNTDILQAVVKQSCHFHGADILVSFRKHQDTLSMLGFAQDCVRKIYFVILTDAICTVVFPVLDM